MGRLLAGGRDSHFLLTKSVTYGSGEPICAVRSRLKVLPVAKTVDD